MLLRLSLNFAAHLVAGVAFGALAAAAAHSMRAREDESNASAQSSTTGAARDSTDEDR